MKMWKKQHPVPCFLLAAAIVCFLFISPAFSEFKKVSECELARTNASVTGQPASIYCATNASWEEESTCNVENAFDACTSRLTEGESIAKEDSLSSPDDQSERDWLKKTQDFEDVYYPVYEKFSPISVEAGTDSYGLYYAPDGSTYIRIGLGSQEVGLDEMDINVTLGSEAAEATGQAQILGSLYIGGLSVKSNGSSYVTMYKNDGQMGIGVNVAAAIDRVALDTLSWGDADGIGGTSRAGYVGLKDTSIRGVTVSGPVALDVETVRTGETSGTYAIGTKYIHVGFDKLDVGVDEIDTTAVIGDKKNFSGDTGVLGTLYLKELNLNVTGHLDLYNETAGDVATLRFGVAIPTLTLDTLSWGDADGYAGATGFGGVGLRNLAIRNLNVAGEATVDEATIQAGEDGISLLPVGTVFVRIGLSKLDLSMESLDTDIALGNRKDNLNQVLGSVYLGDLKMSMTGRVDIHTPSASTQGIVLDLDAKFPQLTMSALSWGDADGFSSHPNAGYVGLRNTEIKGLEVAGRVGIDVATADSSEQASRMSPSFVRITLGSVNADTMPTIGNGGLFIGIKYFGTDMILDSIKTLDSPSRKSLGSLYFSGIEISVKGKINIGAH